MDDARTFKTSQFKVKAIFNNLIPITLSEKEIITSSIEPPSPIQHLRQGAPFLNLPRGAKTPSSVCTPGYAILDTPLQWEWPPGRIPFLFKTCRYHVLLVGGNKIIFLVGHIAGGLKSLGLPIISPSKNGWFDCFLKFCKSGPISKGFSTSKMTDFTFFVCNFCEIGSSFKDLF